MTEIILIATVHRPKGNCNPIELYRIIEEINPDVIFEEQSPQNHTLIYLGQRNDTIETLCIKRFSQGKQIEHLPVDLERKMSSELQNKFAKVFDPFQSNTEYQNINFQREILSQRYGFRFLNSDECSIFGDKLKSIENIIISSSNDFEAVETYRKWTEMNDLRETEMLKNIYKICEDKKYIKGLFLVGAEHRKPIIEKILQKYSNNKSINWNFQYLA
ncbi:hypothetical protein L1S35_05290 [Flavobacterium sp. AS60]|uniref:hypothetical protein n=1 Tax=Flavobacterium anseongense TaxID=2910677 RepID=UPI001F1E4A63|nr:hypothetical protein [Flavobacterium sp. AS60]MCF6129079.1 hypothetical protein [Flavobacterium sp. AS60]